MKPTDSAPLKVKAGRNGFALVPDPNASFESMKAFMEQRLEESRDFFQHVEMTLDLRGKSLRTEEIIELQMILSKKAGVKLTQIRFSDDLSFVTEQFVPAQPVAAQREIFSEVCDAPLIVRSTCRSGTRIVSRSDCVVLGDVNPGAEIIAVGDIIVFGNLRGFAHAGSAGDRMAKIWALSIEPNQLRIAELVAVPPRENKPLPKRYEIAEVQNNLIQVSII
jgi:septum site-determining protein MinC